MNKITLIGNLTRDPEISTTASGVSVCRFGIAVNRRFQTGENGDRVTDFFNIVTWRQQAESCSKFLTKGKKVAVIGELQARTYQDRNGETRLALDVSADEVEFLSPRQDGTGQGEQRYSPAPVQSNSNQQQAPSAGFVDVDDDTLPF